jgi:tRNA pseudouridine38-40 synthase
MPRRIALLIEYDGTDYSGWQRQPNGLSVQEALEQAVAVMAGAFCTVHGSGRTDAGVHGFGQVAHIDLPDACTIPVDKIPRALNAALFAASHPEVAVKDAAHVANGFHARFDAVLREYRYTVARSYSVFRHRTAWQPARAFMPEYLQAAAEVFVGTHDFTTFSKHNEDTANYECVVETASWREKEQDVWELRIRANRYVYGMVRSLVGAMMDVAWERRSVDELRDALKARNRALGSQLAPPQGLVLWSVEYPRGSVDFPTNVSR